MTWLNQEMNLLEMMQCVFVFFDMVLLFQSGIPLPVGEENEKDRRAKD